MLFHLLYAVAAVALLVPTVPLVAELVVLSLAACVRPKRATQAADVASLRIAVVVPAHNEEKLIAACVRSLFASDSLPSAVYVVAHNCTDATAERAAGAGALVLSLSDDGAHGKGAALLHGMTHALQQGAEAVLIVDADSRVSPVLTGEARSAFAAGAAAVQARYVASIGKTDRERLLALGLYGFNVVRPRGRANLSLSCGIFGNGFGVSANTLRAVPYTAHSIVEDLEYHLQLVRSGRRVRFLDAVEVRGEVPDNKAAAATQRARWEGGRALIRRQWRGPLLREVLRGRLRLLEPLLDLISLPTGTVVMLLMLGALPPVFWTRVYAVAGFASIVLYLVVSMGVSEDPMAMLRALASVPKYLLFKLGLIRSTRQAATSDTAWVRTERNDQDETRP